MGSSPISGVRFFFSTKNFRIFYFLSRSIVKRLELKSVSAINIFLLSLLLLFLFQTVSKNIIRYKQYLNFIVFFNFHPPKIQSSICKKANYMTEQRTVLLCFLLLRSRLFTTIASIFQFFVLNGSMQCYVLMVISVTQTITIVTTIPICNFMHLSMLSWWGVRRGEAGHRAEI